jgi:hypothetical protein
LLVCGVSGFEVWHPYLIPVLLGGEWFAKIDQHRVGRRADDVA